LSGWTNNEMNGKEIEKSYDNLKDRGLYCKEESKAG
jgi:hypothetical protein